MPNSTFTVRYSPTQDTWNPLTPTSDGATELASSNTVATTSPARNHSIDAEALRRAYEWLEHADERTRQGLTPQPRDQLGRFAASRQLHPQGNVANVEASRPWNTAPEAPTLLERAGPVNKRGIKGWFAKLDSAAI